MTLVLFDIDKTLTQSVHAHTKAFSAAFKNVFGIETTSSVIPHHSGMTTQQVIREVMLYWQIPQDVISSKMKEALNTIETEFQRLFADETIEVLPGVVTTLQLLSGHGISLGLITANLESIAEAKIKKAGLDHFFCCGGYGNDDPHRHKIIQHALERARRCYCFSPGERVFVVGDTPQDILAAQMAKVQSIGVATGKYSVAELAQTGANWVLPDLTDTEHILKFVTS